jgi:hypothetical protein
MDNQMKTQKKIYQMGGLEKEKTTKNNIKHTKAESVVVVAHP